MPFTDETEAETIADRIRPRLQEAGWGVVEDSRIRAEIICPGRIVGGGKREQDLRCDLVLEYKGRNLAAVEAKRVGVDYGEGVAQAKIYAQRLGARFAYATNGRGWYEMDMESTKEGDIALPFPSPDALWERTFSDTNEWRERFGTVPFEPHGGKWELRYYQYRAITAALEAIARGQKRILLTLATGTGKTAIAFQIVWKLFQAKWNLTGKPDRRPRILFLTDRNILADQAQSAFSAFPEDAISRIDPAELRQRRGSAPKHASVFFTLFQTLTTGERQPVYEKYPSGFFDFIVIDECHRGGARDESRWRMIMEHFASATQLGLTATPKRDANVDTYDYFGEPVYRYALKEGIADGYLTPFKLRRMASTIDEYVYNPEDEVKQGEVEEGDYFTEDDFNRRIIIRERERSRVREFMREMNQNEKTLVFCATQGHAALVRDLINQEKTIADGDYCHRVTSDDGELGEQHLRNFRNNDKTIPTVLTTSRKLSTGVDALNVRNIVLMRPIKSMIEFKQIIGRGTRVYEGKDYFTVWDFVKACENFKDPEWDGEPLPPEPGEKRDTGERETERDNRNDGERDDDKTETEKVIIKLADGKERQIQYIKSSEYMGPDGKMMSPQDFLKMLFGDLSGMMAKEDKLRAVWSDPDTRTRFMEQLRERYYTEEVLEAIKSLVNAPDSDLFDVLNYILFAVTPITREQRAAGVKPDESEEASENMRKFLQRILSSYVQDGESELATDKLTQYMTAEYGSVSEGIEAVGASGAEEVRAAYLTMQKKLYR